MALLNKHRLKLCKLALQIVDKKVAVCVILVEVALFHFSRTVKIDEYNPMVLKRLYYHNFLKYITKTKKMRCVQI